MARVEWYGERAEAAASAGIRRGIGGALDSIAATSQDYVLVQTGELKRSQGTSVDGESGTVYYTDSKAVGAHENLTDTPHRWRNPQARAKFLELAVHERKDDALREIADGLREAL